MPKSVAYLAAGTARMLRNRTSGATTWQRQAGLALCFVAAYIVVYRLTDFLTYSDLRVSPWNPETGLTMAAGAYWGPLGALLSIGARFIAVLISKSVFIPSLDIPATIIHAIVYAMPMYLLRRTRYLEKPSMLVHVGLLAGAGLAGSIVAAALQVFLLSFIIGFRVEWVLPAIATKAIGDFIGVVTVAPLFVLPRQPRETIALLRGNPAGVLAAFIVIAAISYFVFALDAVDDFKFFYLIFFPVVGFALAKGTGAAVLAILASDISAMAIVFFREVSVSTATELQFLMASLAVTGLVLGAVVSDRRRLQQELLESHLQLQSSQSALLQASRRSLVSEMAGALSHELSQPLASARNYIRAVERLLRQKRTDKKQIKELIDDAVTQIDGASDLVRETLSFLQRGDAAQGVVDALTIVDQCQKLIESELKTAGIHLTVTKIKGELPVIANRTQIQQVLLNLLRNSMDAVIASGRPDRRISISAACSAQPGFAELAVSDNGVGIPENLQPLIFMPFNSSKPGGLGLGLPLCKNIVTAHGGKIWLKQSDPGRTEFRFTLRIPASVRRE
jgi:signal transduction histidine kinase